MYSHWSEISGFQLILNPIRDWKKLSHALKKSIFSFQLILNPIRDWKISYIRRRLWAVEFQLILNPIRDWKSNRMELAGKSMAVPINLKPY